MPSRTPPSKPIQIVDNSNDDLFAHSHETHEIQPIEIVDDQTTANNAGSDSDSDIVIYDGTGIRGVNTEVISAVQPPRFISEYGTDLQTKNTPTLKAENSYELDLDSELIDGPPTLYPRKVGSGDCLVV